jgi:hypothetical protein
MRSSLGMLAFVAGCSASRAEPPVATATFSFQFDDAVPAAARAAVERAGHRWGTILHSDVEIVVQVDWVAGLNKGLGLPNTVVDTDGNGRSVRVPSALADALASENLQPGEVDGQLFLSSSEDWYMEPGLPGLGQVDLETVVSRELVHALGVSSTGVREAPTASQPGLGAFGRANPVLGALPVAFPVPQDGLPSLFDTFLLTGEGTPVAALQSPSADLFDALGAAYLDSPRVHDVSDGPLALAADSATHLSEDSTTTGVLLRRSSGEGRAERAPGLASRAILEDLGWKVL